MRGQLNLPDVFVNVVNDFGTFDNEKRRKVRPSRHVRPKGEKAMACGHLTQDGNYVQFPLLAKWFIATTDCPTCKAFVMAKLAEKVVARSRVAPVRNTGVNSHDSR